ncbi:hypothetical protein KL943_005367 [Ogataea angusta]|nr:hypothetical protein KL943_005367 [Ogataea angusta]
MRRIFHSRYGSSSSPDTAQVITTKIWHQKYGFARESSTISSATTSATTYGSPETMLTYEIAGMRSPPDPTMSAVSGVKLTQLTPSSSPDRNANTIISAYTVTKIQNTPASSASSSEQMMVHRQHDGTLVAAQPDRRAERRVREQHDGVREVVHKAPRAHVLHGQRSDHVPVEQFAGFAPEACVFRVEGPSRPHQRDRHRQHGPAHKPHHAQRPDLAVRAGDDGAGRAAENQSRKPCSRVPDAGGDGPFAQEPGRQNHDRRARHKHKPDGHQQALEHHQLHHVFCDRRQPERNKHQRAASAHHQLEWIPFGQHVSELAEHKADSKRETANHGKLSFCGSRKDVSFQIVVQVHSEGRVHSPRKRVDAAHTRGRYPAPEGAVRRRVLEIRSVVLSVVQTLCKSSLRSSNLVLVSDGLYDAGGAAEYPLEARARPGLVRQRDPRRDHGMCRHD